MDVKPWGRYDSNFERSSSAWIHIHYYRDENEWVRAMFRWLRRNIRQSRMNNHSKDVPMILLEFAKTPTAFGFYDKNSECRYKFRVPPFSWYTGMCTPSSACPAPSRSIQTWDIYLRQDICAYTGRASEDPKSCPFPLALIQTPQAFQTPTQWSSIKFWTSL